MYELIDHNTESLAASTKPAVAPKGNAYLREIKKSQRSWSDSGQMNVLSKPAISTKPNVKFELASTTPDLGAGVAVYSELDQNTSYATLEPHIGDVTKQQEPSKESYSHLNH